jgi:hypothetical protein
VQNQRIRVVNITTKIISTIAGNSSTVSGSGGGYAGDGGPAISADMKNPHGIALVGGSTAEYFIADTSNQRIRVVRNGVMGTLLYNTTLLDSVFGVTLDAGSLYTTTRRTFGQVGTAAATGTGSSSNRASSRSNRASNGASSRWASSRSNRGRGKGQLARLQDRAKPTRFVSFCLQVLKVNATTGTYTEVAGVANGLNLNGILATNAKLNNPTYVEVDPVNGTMFITEYGEPQWPADVCTWLHPGFAGHLPVLLRVGNSLSCCLAFARGLVNNCCMLKPCANHVRLSYPSFVLGNNRIRCVNPFLGLIFTVTGMPGTVSSTPYNATVTYQPSGILYDSPNKWLYFTDGELAAAAAAAAAYRWAGCQLPMALPKRGSEGIPHMCGSSAFASALKPPSPSRLPGPASRQHPCQMQRDHLGAAGLRRLMMLRHHMPRGDHCMQIQTRALRHCQWCSLAQLCTAHNGQSPWPCGQHAKSEPAPRHHPASSPPIVALPPPPYHSIYLLHYSLFMVNH